MLDPRHSLRLCIPVGLLLCCLGAWGNGVFVGVSEKRLATGGRPSSAAQKAVLIREGGDEVLLLETTYQGPASAFAWVVPVPAQPSEVFEAEPQFLKAVFENTSPRSSTTLDGEEPEPSGRAMGMKKGALGGAAKAAAPPEQVRVLAQFISGDYRAAVLAASGANSLKAWLDRNGYHLPPDAEPNLAPYVRRGWVFVAVKLLEGAASAQPTLQSVAPLGIRFPARQLVFPLLISRISAPALSAIMLCVIADTPMTCASLPVKWVQQGQQLQVGESYGSFRRRMTHPNARPALLAEFSAVGAHRYTDLTYNARDWQAPRHSDVPNRHATRFFALLAKDELSDLVFVPDTSAPRDYAVMVSRQGTTEKAALGAWEVQPVQLLRGPGGSGASVRSLRWTPPRGDVRFAPQPWAFRLPRGARSARRFLLAVLLVLALVAASVLLALRWRRAPTTLLLLLLGTLLAASVSPGGGRGGGGETAYFLDSVLSLVEEAATAFQQDTGCYPKRVADLASARPPATGLDASGNEVPLRGGFRGPYLSRIPTDPLGAPGLVVDPLAMRLVDSGGFKVEVSGESVAAVARKTYGVPGPGRAVPYWGARFPAPQVLSKPVPYAAWLSARKGAHLVAAVARPTIYSYGGTLSIVRSNTGLVVADLDHQEAVALTSQGAGTVVGITADFSRLVGFTSVGYLSSAPALWREPGAEPEYFTSEPVEGHIETLVISPDGLQVAMVVLRGGNRHELVLADKGGKAREAIAHGSVASLAYSPDGRWLYVLGILGSDADKAEPQAGVPLTPGWGSTKTPPPPASCSLVRFPKGGGEPETVMRDLDGRLLAVGPGGVLVVNLQRQVGIVSPSGGWKPLGALPAGQYVVDGRLFADCAVVAHESSPGATARFTRYPLSGGASEEVETFSRGLAGQTLVLATDRTGITWARGAGENWELHTDAPKPAPRKFTVYDPDHPLPNPGEAKPRKQDSGLPWAGPGPGARPGS